MHVQRMILYPAKESCKKILKELLEHEKYFDSPMQLDETFHDIRMHNEEFETRIQCKVDMLCNIVLCSSLKI